MGNKSVALREEVGPGNGTVAVEAGTRNALSLCGQHLKYPKYIEVERFDVHDNS